MDLMADLVRGADVLVENFGPGTMDSLGLRLGSPGVLLKAWLVYASIKGFGEGKYAARQGL